MNVDTLLDGVDIQIEIRKNLHAEIGPLFRKEWIFIPVPKHVVDQSQ